MTMKAILIEVSAQDIRAADYDDYKDLQDMVGGLLTTAKTWPSGDLLFVDDEGLLKRQAHFFRIAGRDQPFAGNGVVVGPDRYDDAGDCLGADAPGIAIKQLRAEVTFLSRAQADAWGRANASEPAVTLYSLTTDGLEKTVVAHFGRLFAEMPRRSVYSWEIEPGLLLIIDQDQGLSVTNDAEQVIEDFVRRGLDVDQRRILCRDRTGQWNGLVISGGRFAGFIALGKRTREEAIAEARARKDWLPTIR
jgi:hypothetical protein